MAVSSPGPVRATSPGGGAPALAAAAGGVVICVPRTCAGAVVDVGFTVTPVVVVPPTDTCTGWLAPPPPVPLLAKAISAWACSLLALPKAMMHFAPAATCADVGGQGNSAASS